MNCPIVEEKTELLVAYTAGELDADTARELREHLADCEACQAMAVDQAAVWKALDAWEAPPVSADFDQRLYRRIEEGAPLSWWDRLTRAFRAMPLMQVVPLTVSAALLLTVGLLLEYPVPHAPVRRSAEFVHANQVEKTLDDLDLLGQFNTTEPGANVQPHAM